MPTWFSTLDLAEARRRVTAAREGVIVYQPQYKYTPGVEGEVCVAVVDDGCDMTHPKLPEAVRMYNFEAQKAYQLTNTPAQLLNDKSSHGTLSAGLVAGDEDPDAGFEGGGAAGIDGLQFVAARYHADNDFHKDIAMYNKLVADGAKVISNSYGDEYTGNQLIQLGQCFADSAGIFLFAAGNSSKKLTNIAHFQHVILVAATIPPDQVGGLEVKVPQSNYGAGITVCAPGGHAGSRPPLSTSNVGKGKGDGNYDDHGDTSAACAMVAGVVTLMCLAKPNITRAQVIEALCSTTVKVDPNCDKSDGTWATAQAKLSLGQKQALPESLWKLPYSCYYGFGRVDADAAVRAVLALG